MDRARMRYPAHSPHETVRQRDSRRALSRTAARDTTPVKAPSLGTLRIKPTGAIEMPFAVFRHADYGQLCQVLGLSPSKPRASADGKTRRRGRA